MNTPSPPAAPVAPVSPSHGYVLTRPVPGSPYPADYTFVLTHDELYVPVAVRKPPGPGPFPAITVGRGNGRGGLPLVELQVERHAAFLDRMIGLGYVVAWVNYRNEIPHLYGRNDAARNLPDDVSGGEGRTLKSAPTLDSDDLAAVYRYLATLPYVDPARIGAIGASHGGEMILKAAAQTTIAAAVVVEGASHEFLAVDTGPGAPRAGNELQYHDVETVRRHADKAAAMSRIARIRTPVLHIGRDGDHLQGIFHLAHLWMVEAGRESSWVTWSHPEHGYALAQRRPDGSTDPDAVQVQAFERFMAFFGRHLAVRQGGG